MLENYLKFFLLIDYMPLQTIKGIKFTRREIDIIACLLNGRSQKTIAAFLAIAPRTVETHTRNILFKIEGSSRESIINFIEKAGKSSLVRNHYHTLLIQAAFEQQLKIISTQINGEGPTCHLLYELEQENNVALAQQIKGHLSLCGIRITIIPRGVQSSLANIMLDRKNNQKEQIIYIAPPKQLVEQFGIKEANKLSSKFVTNKTESTKPIIFLLLGEGKSSNLSGAANVVYINLSTAASYYLSFFEFLKRLQPTIDLNNIIREFKKRSNLIYDESQKHPIELDIDEPTFTHSNEKLGGLRKLKGQYPLLANMLTIVASLLTIIVLIFGSLTFNQKREKNVKHSYELGNNLPEKVAAIRSDLIIPIESALLQRPQIIAQIDNAFKEQTGIQTVALVGIGGAGKTTLARRYAHQQKADVIWEINAETKGSLRESFKNLANALSKTENDKKILRGLREIKNSLEREEKILRFVKERLRFHPNWLLIYDNVEELADIQKHFPQDADTWGQGKIILTTRDNNIQNNEHVNYTIQIEELDSDEKLNLFTKIMCNGNSHCFTLAQMEETKNFLEKIPPFPLDVSIAGHYLKITNTPYEKYEKYLNEHNENFEATQESILKEVSEYTRTRYSIITLSLKHLVDIHKDFGDLLLFISLLDSQNILKDLLSAYKDDVVVDNFVCNLKKYSLIVNQSSSSFHKISTISIHRSTQSICLAYLTKILGLKENKQYIQAIANTFETFMADAINKDDLEKIRSLIAHSKYFLTHNNLLTDSIRASIVGSLGCMYYCLSHYEKAQHTLEDALANLNKSMTQNYPLKAKLLVYLGIVIKTTGDREKAKGLLENALIIYKNYASDGFNEIAWALLSLGDIYRTQGTYEKAKNVLEQSLTLYKKNNSENYIGKARALLYLGTVYRDLGNYEKSRNILEQSLAIYKKYVHQDHVRIARILAHLGSINRELGNYEKAKALTEQSLVFYKKHFPEDHLDVACTLTYLGRIYTSLGNYEEAKNLHEKSFVIHTSNYPENHIVMAWASLHLGEAYKDLAQYEKAKLLLEKSLKYHESHYGKDHTAIAHILVVLSQVYLLEDNLELAERYLLKSLEIYQKNKHSDQYKVLESLTELYMKKSMHATQEVNMEQSQDFKNQAINYLKQALDIIRKYFPEDSPHKMRIQAKLKNFE